MYYHLYKDCYKAWSTYISVGPARGVVGDSDQVFPVLQGPGLDGGADVGIGVGGGLGEHGAGVTRVEPVEWMVAVASNGPAAAVLHATSGSCGSGLLSRGTSSSRPTSMVESSSSMGLRGWSFC